MTPSQSIKQWPGEQFKRVRLLSLSPRMTPSPRVRIRSFRLSPTFRSHRAPSPHPPLSRLDIFEAFSFPTHQPQERFRVLDDTNDSYFNHFCLSTPQRHGGLRGGREGTFQLLVQFERAMKWRSGVWFISHRQALQGSPIRSVVQCCRLHQ
jgi:hypothetical protein